MLKIGSFELENPVIVAPLSGVTDYPFRMAIRSFGNNLIFSEMLASESLVRSHKTTNRMAVCSKEEQPMAVQLVGNNSVGLAQSAKLCEDKGAVLIDINMGCPAKKIVSNESGSALMKNEKLASDIIKSVRSAIKIPLTVKFRLGWDSSSINALSFAKMAEDCGVDAITVHGRTKMQMYSGTADWDMIARVKEAVRIPVIGNGDVLSQADGLEMIEHTKCDGVMIGRGIMGRPWFANMVYQNIIGKSAKEPTIKELKELTLSHFDNLIKYYGKHQGLRVSRKHISWYTKGLRGSSEFRDIYNRVEDIKEAEKEIISFYDCVLGDKV